MTVDQLRADVAEALREANAPTLRLLFKNSPPSMVGALLRQLEPAQQLLLLEALPLPMAGLVYTFLDLACQRRLLEAMNDSQRASLLNHLPPDDRTRLFKQLPGPLVTSLLALLAPEERKVAVALLGYPPASVGRLMTPDYVAVAPEWTVAQVLDYVREHGADSETLTMIYVVDPAGVLIDDIRIRQFLLAPLSARVTDIMDHEFVALRVDDDQEVAVQKFRREDRKALPVVDANTVLVGIVTIDDVLRVAEAEATEDIQKMGGSEALDEPYMTISLLRMVRKRGGWLVILFLSEMLTATAMGFFENEIEKAVVLALFVPLIISSGGNSGSQASTLVIRALAVGEISLAGWWRVLRREIFVGLALGGILAVIGFLRISIWSAFSSIYGAHWLLVAITVSLALIGVVLWGSLCGAMLPFILRRLGFDPATSSAPFVATLVDVTGLIIYFSIGMLVMRGTLL